jgi:hypothetical protein
MPAFVAKVRHASWTFDESFFGIGSRDASEGT